MQRFHAPATHTSANRLLGRAQGDVDGDVQRGVLALDHHTWEAAEDYLRLSHFVSPRIVSRVSCDCVSCCSRTDGIIPPERKSAATIGMNDLAERTWTRVPHRGHQGPREDHLAAERRENLSGGEIVPRAEDNEPAGHRVSNLIKFVVPGHPTGTPAVMTTGSPRCTCAAASAAPRAPSISFSFVGWL